MRDVGGYDMGEAVALRVGNVDPLPGQHRVAVERPRHLQKLELLSLQQSADRVRASVGPQHGVRDAHCLLLHRYVNDSALLHILLLRHI